MLIYYRNLNSYSLSPIDKLIHLRYYNILVEKNTKVWGGGVGGNREKINETVNTMI